MNSVMSATPGRLDHPPHSTTRTVVAQTTNHRVRRVGLLDRAAMHLGVALIHWGRRRIETESREHLASLFEQQRARLERERGFERWARLNQPSR